MSKSDMERAREWLERKQGPLVERGEIESIASLIQEVRNETLDVAADVAEQTVVQKPICSTREQHQRRGKVMPSLTRQAIAQEIRALKSQTQDSKEGDE